MVAQCRKNASVGKIIGQLADRFSQDVEIVVTRLIPDVMRWKIARPDDEINILVFN